MQSLEYIVLHLHSVEPINKLGTWIKYEEERSQHLTIKEDQGQAEMNWPEYWEITTVN